MKTRYNFSYAKENNNIQKSFEKQIHLTNGDLHECVRGTLRLVDVGRDDRPVDRLLELGPVGGEGQLVLETEGRLAGLVGAYQLLPESLKLQSTCLAFYRSK